ncbi:hypothetical protein ACWDKQ_15325 [Saccharopolyspora sp. NPDC000995]
MCERVRRDVEHRAGQVEPFCGEVTAEFVALPDDHVRPPVRRRSDQIPGEDPGKRPGERLRQRTGVLAGARGLLDEFAFGSGE